MTQPVDFAAIEENLRRSARILGEQSASAKALAELDRRRQTEEDLVIFINGENIVVGPRPTLFPLF